MKSALVWLRRDLRLADNPALTHALSEAREIAVVYVHAPQEERNWAPGAASRWWLHHSLTRLGEALSARGARLILRTGSSADVLKELVRETGAQAVYWNRLYEPRLQARDERIAALLRANGIETTSFPAALLFEPWAIRSHKDGPYQVFTPFWRACRRTEPPSAPSPAPRRINAPARGPLSESLDSLELLPRVPWDAGIARAWTPGEHSAAKRLRRFARGALHDYPRARNVPYKNGVSRLSPHLHFGELTPRQIWHALSPRGPAGPRSEAAEAFLRQVLWREFAYHVLHHWPHTPEQPMRGEFNQFPWRKNYGHLFAAWQRGQTGFPLVDAGMRELWASGWMHNRVRMIVASFLVKNCRVPWQEGARWFWDTLVDADLANNSMGWQWTAGCGADAAPYFRIFNPVLQSRKFDPAGHYIRRWVPELAQVPQRYVHAPENLPERLRQKLGFLPGRDYPLPLLDFAASRKEALAAYVRFKRHR